MGWSDLGTWSSVQSFTTHDEEGNSVRGDAMTLDCRNVHVRSAELLTAAVGLEDVIVVTTPDAVLVLNAKEADKVKVLVDDLKRRNRREVVEHRRVYRPWGYYQSIDQGSRYQVKRILVRPGGQLSLQKHFHRAEHWIVVKGTAEVSRNEEVVQVHENESIYLPIGCKHRLSNPGKIDLELIEVQTGTYLGEDDIVRFEDRYNRV
jgi:mannose-1-phosphate guanylyltransferase/mannose-6-phosphate isomerase